MEFELSECLYWIIWVLCSALIRHIWSHLQNFQNGTRKTNPALRIDYETFSTWRGQRGVWIIWMLEMNYYPCAVLCTHPRCRFYLHNFQNETRKTNPASRIDYKAFWTWRGQCGVWTIWILVCRNLSCIFSASL